MVGGCGTGQGYLNAVMQFPRVCCGLIQEPLDAWLFSQINGGNCISLALNKGYGWAANLNLEYIFEKLLQDPAGQGYPEARKESQGQSRAILQKLSVDAHKTLPEILQSIDAEILRTIAGRIDFMQTIAAAAGAEPELQKIIEIISAKE